MIRDRRTLLTVCTAVSVMSLIVSNIITNKQVELPWGWAITCGSVCIPLSYIVDDVLAEAYGYRTAKEVVLTGFAVAAIAVLYFQLTLAVPGNDLFTAQEAFETVLGTTWRTTFASFIAYILGSLSNAKVMEAMRARDGEGRLGWRCILSTIVGETLDMAVFAVLAFSGTMPLATMGQVIVSNSAAKVLVEVVLYPLVTRRVLGWAKALPDAA